LVHVEPGFAGVELPQVDCMPAPPGNKMENGKLVPPLGHDGVPRGLVGCFFSDKDGSHYVFNVNGDGEVERRSTS
jgi:hypothetical protein